MLHETPRIAGEDRYSDVTVSRTEPWTPEQLEEARNRRYHEDITYLNYRKGVGMDFLQETNHSYRENSGAEPLDITLADGTWAELFNTLRSKPKRFFSVPTEAFVGTTSAGEQRTPSIPTIHKALDREAWKHGMILGYATVDSDETRTVNVKDDNGNVTGTRTVPVPRDDVFQMCYRPNVLKVPKRIQRLGLSRDQFGIAVRQDNDQQ